MPQVRRALVTLISVIAVVLGFAPTAFAQPSAAVSNASPRAASPSVHAQAVDPSQGYWLATQNGGIFSAGGADTHGSAIGITLAHPIVGIASTPTRKGYWLVASDGGIFSFGDAAFHGSTGAIVLNKPITGMASTPSGHGYWLVASDGGIFSFGDAHFYGSTGAIVLNKPITGIASTPSGHGYWMVASDGGIFSFGDAGFYGSTGAMTLNQPIVGMAATATGHGYWFVAADGGIFSFGDAHFYGSTGAMTLNQPIVGMAATATGHGYWFVAADGGVFTFGDAHFFGSGTEGAHAPVVGMAPSAFTPATKLAFTTEPGNAAAGSAFSTQPVVTVQNAGGATAMNDTSDVTLAVTTPGGESFGCSANPQAAVAGVATFTDCGIDTPGAYTLTATDGALTAAVSTAITIAPGATQLAFTTQPSATATGGTAFARQPVVEVRDAGGHLVSTDTSAVTLTLTTPAGATLTCNPDSNAAAAVAGVATFTGCDINRSSVTPYTLTASDGGLTPATSTGTVVSVGAANRVGFTIQPSASTGGVAFGTQPRAAVQDAGGNTVTTANTGTVTLTITQPSAPVGAVLACTTGNARNVTAGLSALFVGCNIDLASTTTYTLRGTYSVGALVGTSAPFAVTTGPATQVGFVQQPSASTVSSVAFASQPHIAVQDAGGNTLTALNSGTVALAISAPNTPGAVLGCSTLTVAVVNGVATFVGCNMDKVGSGYTLAATRSGVTGATSTALAITAGVATHMVFTTQPGTAAVNAALVPQPVVTVEDAAGNTVTAASNVTLTLNNPPAGAMTCTSASPLPTVNGMASFTGCQINTSGTFTLHAVSNLTGVPALDSGAVVIP